LLERLTAWGKATVEDVNAINWVNWGGAWFNKQDVDVLQDLEDINERIVQDAERAIEAFEDAMHSRQKTSLARNCFPVGDGSLLWGIVDKGWCLVLVTPRPENCPRPMVVAALPLTIRWHARWK